jgi:serine/threonine-protein kinase HipA
LPVFLDAVAFNVVIGNADSHARNYSVLLHRDGRVELAPLYDLNSTYCYEGLDKEFAQRVNGRYELDAITAQDIIQEGITWGIPERVATSRVRGVIERIAASTEAAAETAVPKGAEIEVLAHVSEVVAARANRLLG